MLLSKEYHISVVVNLALSFIYFMNIVFVSWASFSRNTTWAEVLRKSNIVVKRCDSIYMVFAFVKRKIYYFKNIFLCWCLSKFQCRCNFLYHFLVQYKILFCLLIKVFSITWLTYMNIQWVLATFKELSNYLYVERVQKTRDDL